MSDEREDQALSCIQCGAQFVFSRDEQEFFESKGLHSPPKRCKPCRAARRKEKRGRNRGRMKEYRGPGFQEERKRNRGYRAPAFRKKENLEGIYRSPAFKEREAEEVHYSSPAFRDAEDQQVEYTAPAFRPEDNPAANDGILSGRPVSQEDTDVVEEHDLENGPPPDYHEPRSPNEIYTSPAFSDTDPSFGYRRRAMHEITCAECGKKSQVPFKPRKDRAVYCKECYGQKKRG